jgi:D-3-phosphoglycerate dehydrogenase
VTRVLVREPIADAGVDVLRSDFDVDVDFDTPLEEIVGDYDAIVIRSGTKLDESLLAKATHLRVIGRAGVGVDNVDVDAATRLGILVVNTPESTVVSAAEHTIGLMLALSRNIPQAHASVKAGQWERARYAGLELAGKTLGLLGFGRIGQQVARRALALGMTVMAYDPFVSRERFRELGVEGASSQEAVFATSHLVSLHLPLNDETRAVVDEGLLAHAREGIRIVNTARGELVDEAALLEALRSGRVAAAALDVFSSEPYSGPLLELENVIVTPHLAASTEEAQDRAGVIVAEEVAAALQGELVANAVNMPAVTAEEIEALGPYAPLVKRLGALAMELAEGRAERVVISYRGRLAEHDTRPLTVAALNGVFEGRTGQPVNAVNASLVAAERGIAVEEQSDRASPDYTSLVEVCLQVETDEASVSGTILGSESRHWLVGALGFKIEIELAPLMVFFQYDDRPGVIGRVGTLFGEAGINIANMAVSRTDEGGRALMALSIDTPAPAELVTEFRAAGFADARFIRLD